MWSMVDLEPWSLKKCHHLEELKTPWGDRGAQGPGALQLWAWLCRACLHAAVVPLWTELLVAKGTMAPMPAQAPAWRCDS